MSRKERWPYPARARLILLHSQEQTMKTLALLGVAALAIACDSPTSPRAPLKAPTTLSNAVLTNDRFENVVTVFDGCNGELVTIDANFHVVIGVTSDGAGGFHITEQENVQGQGSSSGGVNYVLAFAFTNEFTLVAAEEATLTETFDLISKGNTPNQEFQVDEHITITPNGDVSSVHFNFRLTCQGS
jgi:hypothetical protein